MYDSNGPSVRIRGSALQIFEKYSQLARDSQRTDRIAAENLAQHAEHYFRIANANNALANNNNNSNSNNDADRRGNQGRPNGAGQDSETNERYPQAGDGDSRPSEDANGQPARQQRQEPRQQQEQQHQADGQPDRQAESEEAETRTAVTN